MGTSIDVTCDMSAVGESSVLTRCCRHAYVWDTTDIQHLSMGQQTFDAFTRRVSL